MMRNSTGRWQRDKDKATFWRRQIALQKSSGESIATFCKKHNFAQSTFCNWKRELTLRDRESNKTEEVTGEIDSQFSFFPVRLVEPNEKQSQQSAARPAAPAEVKTSELEINLLGTATLIVKANTNLALVAKLLNALESK